MNELNKEWNRAIEAARDVALDGCGHTRGGCKCKSVQLAKRIGKLRKPEGTETEKP